MYFTNMEPGAMMIPQKRGGTYERDQHAFVITKVTSSGLWIYHANVDSNCDIAYNLLTFQNLITYYETLAWIFLAP